MIKKVKCLAKSEEGQAMTEYGMIVGIIAIGIVLALVALQMQVAQFITRASEVVSESIASVRPPAP